MDTDIYFVKVHTKLMFFLPFETQLALLLHDGEMFSQVLFLSCSELFVFKLPGEKTS